MSRAARQAVGTVIETARIFASRAELAEKIERELIESGVEKSEIVRKGELGEPVLVVRHAKISVGTGRVEVKVPLPHYVSARRIELAAKSLGVAPENVILTSIDRSPAAGIIVPRSIAERSPRAIARLVTELPKMIESFVEERKALRKRLSGEEKLARGLLAHLVRAYWVGREGDEMEITLTYHPSAATRAINSAVSELERRFGSVDAAIERVVRVEGGRVKVLGIDLAELCSDAVDACALALVAALSDKGEKAIDVARAALSYLEPRRAAEAITRLLPYEKPFSIAVTALADIDEGAAIEALKNAVTPSYASHALPLLLARGKKLAALYALAMSGRTLDPQLVDLVHEVMGVDEPRDMGRYLAASHVRPVGIVEEGGRPVALVWAVRVDVPSAKPLSVPIIARTPFEAVRKVEGMGREIARYLSVAGRRVEIGWIEGVGATEVLALPREPEKLGLPANCVYSPTLRSYGSVCVDAAEIAARLARARERALV